MLASQEFISSPLSSVSAACKGKITPLIIVRSAEPGDYRALHQLFAQQQIAYWTIEVPFTPAGVQNYRRVSEDSEGCYLLVASAGVTVIGSLGLLTNANPRLRHVARLSLIAVHPNWQGQGVGSKLMKAALEVADQWLNLHRLELLVYTDNESAIALYHKFGFTVEGILRSRAFRAGRYTDVQIMARIKGD